MNCLSPRGLDLIQAFEGFSPTPYRCPAGVPTIGYGHVIGADESFDTLSEEQALDLLRQDVQEAESAVCRLIHVPLASHQFDALVSFTFNVGAGALQRSTLRRQVNREEHDTVPSEFLRWVHAGPHILPGLVRRRQAEAQLYGGDGV